MTKKETENTLKVIKAAINKLGSTSAEPMTQKRAVEVAQLFEVDATTWAYRQSKVIYLSELCAYLARKGVKA